MYNKLNVKYKYFFCGLTKNCIDTIGSNLDFLLSFKNSSNFKNVYFISVDSDSIDGTKIC